MLFSRIYVKDPDKWLFQTFSRACSSVVEHLTFNQRVDGSNPSGLTMLNPNGFAWRSHARRPLGQSRALHSSNSKGVGYFPSHLSYLTRPYLFPLLVNRNEGGPAFATRPLSILSYPKPPHAAGGEQFFVHFLIEHDRFLLIAQA